MSTHFTLPLSKPKLIKLRGEKSKLKNIRQQLTHDRTELSGHEFICRLMLRKDYVGYMRPAAHVENKNTLQNVRRLKKASSFIISHEKVNCAKRLVRLEAKLSLILSHT